MKLAPLYYATKEDNTIDHIIVDSGQHYDNDLSANFLKEFNLGSPKYSLRIGSASANKQIGHFLIKIDQIFLDENPDIVLVYGDTNTTAAGAIAAVKSNIPLAHIEAGLRSFNMSMPEEINRIMTDHISTLLLVPSQKSVDNLNLEGLSDGVHIVGDIMKDLVIQCIEDKAIGARKTKEPYYYVTLHRPYNVDEEHRLRYVLESLNKLDKRVIFAAHPRTQNKIKSFGLDNILTNIEVIDPQPYFENLNYLFHSAGLITDSGGMQKEAYWLKKPCTTIRSETEWVETLADDWNVLLFSDLTDIEDISKRTLKDHNENLYGNGKAAEEICKQIATITKSQHQARVN